MTNFVLIDLASQADAVWQCVGGLSQSEILAWLSDRGTVTHIQDSIDAHLYSFRSRIGIESTFRGSNRWANLDLPWRLQFLQHILYHVSQGINSLVGVWATSRPL